MGNQALGHRAVQESNDEEKEMKRVRERERKNVTERPDTHGGAHTYRCTHKDMHRHTYITSCIVFIYLWIPPLYGTPFP